MGGRALLVASLVALLVIAGLGWRLSVVEGELELTQNQLEQTRRDYAEDTQRWAEALDQKTQAVDAQRAAGESGFKALDTANADCRALVANVLKAKSRPAADKPRTEVADEAALRDNIRFLNRNAAR